MEPLNFSQPIVSVRLSEVQVNRPLSVKMAECLHALYSKITAPFLFILPAFFHPSIRKISNRDLNLLLKISESTGLSEEESEQVHHYLTKTRFFERLDLKEALKTRSLFFGKKGFDHEQLDSACKTLSALSEIVRIGGGEKKLLRDLNDGKNVEQYYELFSKGDKKIALFLIGQLPETDLKTSSEMLYGLSQLSLAKHYHENKEYRKVWQAILNPNSSGAKKLERFSATVKSTPFTDFTQSFHDQEYAFYFQCLEITPSANSIPKHLPFHTKKALELINEHVPFFNPFCTRALAEHFTVNQKELMDLVEKSGGRHAFKRILQEKTPDNPALEEALSRMIDAFSLSSDHIMNNPYSLASYPGPIKEKSFYHFLPTLSPLCWFTSKYYNGEELKKFFLKSTESEIKAFDEKLNFYQNTHFIQWTKNDWVDLLKLLPLLKDLKKLDDIDCLYKRFKSRKPFKWSKKERKEIYTALITIPTIENDETYINLRRQLPFHSKKWNREEKKTAIEALKCAKEIVKQHREKNYPDLISKSYDQKRQLIDQIAIEHQEFIHYIYLCFSIDQSCLDALDGPEDTLEKIWYKDFEKEKNLVHWKVEAPLDQQDDSSFHIYLKNITLELNLEPIISFPWIGWYEDIGNNKLYTLTHDSYKKNDFNHFLEKILQSKDSRLNKLLNLALKSGENPFKHLKEKMKKHLDAYSKGKISGLNPEDKLNTDECIVLYHIQNEDTQFYSDEFNKLCIEWNNTFALKKSEDFIDITFYRSNAYTHTLKKSLDKMDEGWKKKALNLVEPFFRRFMKKHFPYGHTNFVLCRDRRQKEAGIWRKGVYCENGWNTRSPHAEQYTINPVAFFPKNVETTQEKVVHFSHSFFKNLKSMIGTLDACIAQNMSYPKGEPLDLGKRALGFNARKKIHPAEAVARESIPGEDKLVEKEAFCSQFVALKLIEAALFTYNEYGYSLDSLETFGFHRGENLDAMHPKKLRDRLLKIGAITLNSHIQELTYRTEEDGEDD